MTPEKIEEGVEKLRAYSSGKLPPAEALQELTRLAAAAEKSGELSALEARAGELGPELGLHLRGEVLARRGEGDEALGPWLTLCDRLANEEAWHSLRHVAGRALEGADSPAAARHLLQLARTDLGWEAVYASAGPVLRSLPRDPRAAFLAARAREAGEEGGAASLYAAALEGAVREDDHPLAEEAFLRLLEEESDRAILQRALLALLLAARRGAAAWAGPLLELGEAAFQEAELHGIFLEEASRALQDGADLEPLRTHLVAALREEHRNRSYLPGLLKHAGVEDEEVPLAEAFRKIHEGLEFPPGRYVRHPTFGVGPVLDFDGERVTIDFPREGKKAMTLAMSRRALELLPSEDIRVQLARDPDAIEGEMADDPPALIVRALRHLGGEGEVKQLKEVLAPAAMSDKSWNGWWRKAREACLHDPRIDASEAYRDAYRLPTEGSGEAPLPDLARVRQPAEAMALMRRLLRDRPEAAEAAGEKYAPLLEKWLGKRDVPPKVRGAALPYLARWSPDRQEEWAAAAARLLGKGIDLNELPGAVEQEGFLDLGLASAGFEPAVMAGLSSRYTRVRDRAMAALAERGDEAMEGVFRKLLTARDTRALAHVTAWYAGGGEGGFDPARLHAWRMVPAVFAALAAGAQATVQKELLALLGAEGPLAARLAADPCPHDLHGALRMALRSLRADPALARLGRTFLGAAGGGEAIEGETEEAPAASPEAPAAAFLISRFTRHKLEDEAARLTKELNTTIPEAILKAREHGDISENAEYDAAKEKQAHTAGRVAQIQEQLRMAQILDEAPWEEGTISPGAYIGLDGGEEGARQVWVLGDGEDEVAPEAVSYRSPVGQALLGRKVGEAVVLRKEGREISYTVVSVERRLPS